MKLNQYISYSSQFQKKDKIIINNFAKNNLPLVILNIVMRSIMKKKFYFGGTSLLIVVNVTMDTVSQVQSHLLAHQYEGLIRKSNLRGRRR